MKLSGEYAENNHSKIIKVNHVNKAIKKANHFCVKRSSDLDTNCEKILKFVKKYSGKRIKDIYDLVIKSGFDISYRQFYRKIKMLDLNKYIVIMKVFQGRYGNSSVVYYLE